MSQSILIKRSSSTAITPGVTTLAFGEFAETNIGGVVRLYCGNSSNVAFEVAGDAYAKLASPAFTGTPTAPTASVGTNTTQVATTAFVTTAVQTSAAGLVNKGNVKAATVSALPAYTYNNGTAGVGATITADANGALPTIDGVTLTDNDLLLVQDETSTNAPYNGIYVVTDAGDGSNPFVLTRATNFNSSSTILPNSIVTVIQGTTNGDKMFWTADIDGTVTVGTTDIVFSLFAAGTSYSAGNGIDISGSTISAKYDNSSIGVNGSSQLEVKAGGVTNDMLAGSIADTKLSTITTANKVSGSAVQLASGSAIANNTGLDVTIDATSIVNNAGSLEVGTVDGGTF